MDKLKTFLNHERYQVISYAVVIAILIFAYGCESKVRSILDPTRMITRTELNIEVDTYLASVEHRYKQLDREDLLKQTLFQNAMLYAQTGTINPFGLMTTIAGILGIGATVDNVRKRKEIKRICDKN